MEMIRSTDTQYERYEMLLLRRDHFRKAAEQIRIVYIASFGQLLTDVFNEKIECIKRKKILSYYQYVLNHGGMADQDELNRYLEREMAAYYENLEQMLEDYICCRDAETSSEYEVQRSKTIYRRLAKLIHPDINPMTEKSTALTELWNRVVIAYGQNAVKELEELEVLVRKALEDAGVDPGKVSIPDIAEKIETLEEEIQEIMDSEPYVFRVWIKDKKSMEKKRDTLRDELASYRGYREELDELIREMLEKGGISIKWRLN